MDFGNYTIGSLVDGRGNYDFGHREYSVVRRQIADRMRLLGYSTHLFNDVDKQIARARDLRWGNPHVDRYGKKYSWIAFFEMYGLRCAMGQIEDYPTREPRSPYSDLDPSFPRPIREWIPPTASIFEDSPRDDEGWIEHGGIPDYAAMVHLASVDGVSGPWVLLEANFHEGVDDGRELRGEVRSAFARPGSISALRAEVTSGASLTNHALPAGGADYYTYHGEIPWSHAFGSDIRNAGGAPRRLGDRAFDYFDNHWRPGVPVEATTRRWSWESHHSDLNQLGGIYLPAPALAVALDLRVSNGSSDMIDDHGRVATIYRQAPGPGFGTSLLYMRRDLVDRYALERELVIVHTITGERTLNYRKLDRQLPEGLQSLFQNYKDRFSTVVWPGEATVPKAL
jgi:hypothetical protein